MLLSFTNDYFHFICFFFNDTATTEIYTLSLHDALPIYARVAGLVVNRFRGDPSVLGPGLDLLTARTGVPVLGVVPHLGEAPLPEEDSLGLETAPRDVADAWL